MSPFLLVNYKRTITVFAVFIGLAGFETLKVRTSIYPDLLPFFEWLKNSTWIGILGTTYGSIYATVEAVHLVAMATIGGIVLTVNLRLLNLVLRRVPSEVLTQGTQKAFSVALIAAVLTGIFCAAGVADKVYYLQVFWVKMLALVSAACFVYLIERPLLNQTCHKDIHPAVIRLLAIASLLIWFTVAATGRWIGFS